MSYICSKCNKSLSSKQNLNKHETNCNGLQKTQCELCHKNFSSLRSKYRHKKDEICKNNRTMIQANLENSNHNTINQIGVQNIENQTNNYHIHLHFGNENLEYLSQDLKENFWLNYLDPEILKKFHKELHFNEQHPENHTIAKTDLNRNEYHVKLESGVIKIKFNELYNMMMDLYNKFSDILNSDFNDLSTYLEKDMFKDTVHYNKKGHEKISKIISKKIINSFNLK